MVTHGLNATSDYCWQHNNQYDEGKRSEDFLSLFNSLMDYKNLRADDQSFQQL